jgi:hypothetical protein
MSAYALVTDDSLILGERMVGAMVESVLCQLELTDSERDLFDAIAVEHLVEGGRMHALKLHDEPEMTRDRLIRQVRTYLVNSATHLIDGATPEPEQPTRSGLLVRLAGAMLQLDTATRAFLRGDISRDAVTVRLQQSAEVMSALGR